MRRRNFIAFMAAAAALIRPPRARAQSTRVRRLGVLMAYAADDPEAQLRVHALESRLRELGWTIRQDLEIDYAWVPGGDQNALRQRATQLVTAGADVILCQSTPVLMAVLRESKTTPIIFVQVTDPVASGFVQSLARPGGRITGFTDFEYDIGGKWMEVLKEIAPSTKTITVIAMAGHAGNAGIFRAMERVAPSLGVHVVKTDLEKNSSPEQAIVADNAINGLIVLPSPVASADREAIINLAARRQLPACYPLRYFAASGGLVAYGINQVDQWRRAGAYVDRVLRGEPVADLPVQQPNKFELVINLKTAKALGLAVAPALLASANEVIE